MITFPVSRTRPAAACLLAASLLMGCKGVTPPDERAFVVMARRAGCADQKNRLYMIDGSTGPSGQVINRG